MLFSFSMENLIVLFDKIARFDGSSEKWVLTFNILAVLKYIFSVASSRFIPIFLATMTYTSAGPWNKLEVSVGVSGMLGSETLS